jgi:hypothetical protein
MTADVGSLQSSMRTGATETKAIAAWSTAINGISRERSIRLPGRKQAKQPITTNNRPALVDFPADPWNFVAIDRRLATRKELGVQQLLDLFFQPIDVLKDGGWGFVVAAGRMSVHGFDIAKECPAKNVRRAEDGRSMAADRAAVFGFKLCG